MKSNDVGFWVDLVADPSCSLAQKCAVLWPCIRSNIATEPASLSSSSPCDNPIDNTSIISHELGVVRVPADLVKTQ